jgi:flavin-dependent dehydrogenase
VVIVEARRGVVDRACGEGLMPAALAALAVIGVEPSEGGQPFGGIRYVAGARVAEATFPGGARGLGLARTELHAALRAAAERAGVELHDGVRATGLIAEGIATDAGEIRARFVVGADGLRSRVRSWAGLARAPGRPARFGVRRHLALAPADARVEVHFGRGAEAYLTPLAPDRIGVALLWEGPARGFDALLAERFPEPLRARLAGGRALGRDLGRGPFGQRARAAARGRVALVGDAGGYVDPLTGEGLALAFEEARALAPALARGDLAAYARASARLRRLPEALTRLALFAARRPRLLSRVVAALARDPELFAALLGALGARRPLGDLRAAALARFSARLLLPAPLPAR